MQATMRPDHVKAANRRLLSTEEVAEALCVTTKTVRRWIARGELPAVKLHRQWRVRVTDLDHLLRPSALPDAPSGRLRTCPEEELRDPGGGGAPLAM